MMSATGSKSPAPVRFAVTTLLLTLTVTLVHGAESASNPDTVSVDANDTKQAPAERKSPWLLTPLLSSNPKFGTSVGALGAYLHHFDKESPVSLFGITGNYSDTRSWNVALFTNAFFDEDKQRVSAVAVGGKVENDYEDFLGTGQQAATTDNIELFFARYQYRIAGNWFIGAQGIITNYTSSAGTDLGQGILDILGLAGFQSNGIGAVVYYDSRDHTRSPSSGSQFRVHNLAFRKSLGGDESFDAYNVEYDTYHTLLKNQVTALQLNGRWTVDAPASAYSSVQLPGYTRGEYLAEYMTSVFGDQRITFTPRWGMSVSLGLACLYGDDVFGDRQSCSERANLYPSVATGAIFTLKPEEKIVIRAELAAGKSDNTAFVLSFGQPF